MVKKMLIDATHAEETRVVVVDGTRLEEFDVETSTKRQLKGNIYLAKVIRVEPSLQAAFVDYGNDRHGFLPFSEIHPDYYQIPVADREELKASLIKSQQDSARREEEEVEKMLQSEEEEKEDDDIETEIEEDETVSKLRRKRHGNNHHRLEMKEAAEVKLVSDTDDIRNCRNYFDMLRRYKIQEVIHRNQILLVQVVKEERGNKGAALTTYLSLAGRYCVLMPNNARGGGVSRKISNISDRHKLKTIVNSLPIPEGMSVIIRTAGRERTKVEIKRDYEYLIKTWVQIRDMTMASVAPTLIHEEGNLIRRCIRDIYTPDIAEIIIEGEGEYKATKDFVKMIIPNHAKKVTNYTDDIPLFHRYQVEAQLESLHSPIVQLKSGGYLVINPTEALVAIDVNSGRSTKEHSIEDTALKTNLEAVEEVARQLKLRDLAGLIVIDLIDMEEPRNNMAVERKMRDILHKDRARVQMAKINGFGLMELSRQRLHSSFIETSYHTCPYCQGTGVQRSVESISVHLLRVLDEEGVKQRHGGDIILTVPSNIALYVLNHKRALLNELESLYDIHITVNGDDSFISPSDYRLERIKRREIVEPEPIVEEEEKQPVPAKAKEGKGKKNKAKSSATKTAMPKEDEEIGFNMENLNEGIVTEAPEENEDIEKKASRDNEARGDRQRSGRRGLFGRRRNRRFKDYDDGREPAMPNATSAGEIHEEAIPEVTDNSDKKENQKGKKSDSDEKQIAKDRSLIKTEEPKAKALVKVESKKLKGAVILFSSHPMEVKVEEKSETKITEKISTVVENIPASVSENAPKKRGRKLKVKEPVADTEIPEAASEVKVKRTRKTNAKTATKKEEGNVTPLPQAAAVATQQNNASEAISVEDEPKKVRKGGWWSKFK